MCGATVGGPALAGADLTTATVIQGIVAKEGAPVAGAYVRLLDAAGEFTAEVVSSATGQFRFFAGPGTWTLRVLSRAGGSEVVVTAERGTVAETEVHLAA